MFNYGFIKLVILFTLIVSWGTRAQETLDWLNDIPVGGWPGATLGPHSNNTVCHSRGTLTAQHFNPFNLILPSGTPFAFAINNNSIIFGTSATPAGRGVTQTLNFSYPVENLTFSVFDIDGNNGNWQDRIIITASLAGNAVPITIVTCPTVAGTVCMGSGTNTVQIDAGITPTGFAAANGRGDISIAGALDAVVIQYQNHTVPVSTTGFISLTQLTYNCAIIGVSKLMTRRVGQALGVSPYIVDIDFNFENFGDVTLSALTALDDLQTVFNTPPNINNYSVSSITTTSGPVTFNANAAFNGNTVQELIAAGSSLAAGQTASIRVTLAVNNYDSYNNSITLTATTPQGAVTADNSFNGTDPDGFNGDNNPDESSISNLNTTSLPVSLNYISSNRQNNNILIQWQTDIEFEHIGFVLYQEDGGGDKYPLSDLITSSNETSKQGLKNYQFRANSQSNGPIWLLEYSNKGTEKWYGPFAVNAS
ncbi:MAG TPA: hypothetical protein ENJ41_04135, partial [Oceanospirillales bacterium]|nr:hypothetical protein [Oceanospirillales bacterium]